MTTTNATNGYDDAPPSVRRTLILVRHARTQWNEEGRYQGHLDSPVAAYGRLQIASAAKRLQDEAVDAVFTSDLGRSLLTADRIARSVYAPVIVDPRFREQSFGVFEGQTHEYVREHYPEIVEQSRITEDPEFCVPCGESKAQLHRRIMPAVYDALQYPGTDQIVLIGHGSLIRVFLNYVTGLGLPSRDNKIPRNCSISIVKYDHGVWKAELIGDDSHLPVLA